MDKYLENNWVLRILALILAIGVWSQVYPPMNPVASHVVTDVPVTVINVRPGTTAEPVDRNVTVDLRGTESVLTNLRSGQIVAQVDIRKGGPGVHRETVVVYVPAGSEVIWTRPQTVVVDVRRRT